MPPPTTPRRAIATGRRPETAHNRDVQCLQLAGPGGRELAPAAYRDRGKLLAPSTPPDASSVTEAQVSSEAPGSVSHRLTPALFREFRGRFTAVGAMWASGSGRRNNVASTLLLVRGGERPCRFLTTTACVAGRRRTAASARGSGAHSGDAARGYLLDDQSAGAPRHRCGLERAGALSRKRSRRRVGGCLLSGGCAARDLGWAAMSCTSSLVRVRNFHPARPW